MKIDPFYCDMHIHTYADANHRDGTSYDSATLLKAIHRMAQGHCAMISLTDHNTINSKAYADVLSSHLDDVVLILGVELHVKSNGPKPYHSHAYFNVPHINTETINSINAVLDKLYPNKLPSKSDNIPTLPVILNSLRAFEFLFLPHGGQSHSTFDNAVEKGELFDDVLMRSIYYNTFDGFTARSCANVDDTESYFEQIGIAEFTGLLTGSDNYDPSKYPKPKNDTAESFTPTWVFAEPTFEGLRMALSEKTRLCYQQDPPAGFFNPLPSIEHIQLSNTNVDIDVELSSGLNVIIGGSSTGKTLLLEAIARKTGILSTFETHPFYNKFGIDDIKLERNDSTSPYYINQSYISKVVDKSVNHDTIESIQILKDVFPEDRGASEMLDTNFGKVRNLVSKMFAAADAAHQAEQALLRLPAPCDLITDGSLDSNPITILQPSPELSLSLAWNQAAVDSLLSSLLAVENMFDQNPLLPYIHEEAEALRRRILFGKSITGFEQEIATILDTQAQSFSLEENAAKKSDERRRAALTSVLKGIVALKSNLEAFSTAKELLISQEFKDVPKTKCLAGHRLSVVYSFKMSGDALLQAINDLLTVGYKFDFLQDVTAEGLAACIEGIDHRRNIPTLASMGEAVAHNLERLKRRTFSIITRNGQNWDELSEGRKTAVLLDLILEFDGNSAPLIIDQPEDNLAADYINDGLATAIKDSKKTRQTIVVTHNATIPMLADAQTIVLCRNVAGKLVSRSATLEGSIDGKRSLDWVVEITDGGEPSVQKRFHKYNFRRFGGR